MTGQELLDLMNRAHRRSHVTGTPDNGIIAALDLEGRLFAVISGKVLNRVLPSAIINRSNKTAYLNPGGDALWPAPEGTYFGYEYNTGNWRVPPSITGSVWEVIAQDNNKVVIRAEVDLVNNSQAGIPCEFERHIEIRMKDNCLVKNVTEVIRYIGKKPLHKGEFLLAPWSLCQFDSGPEARIVMPPPNDEDIWDIYDPSNSQRHPDNGSYVINPNTLKRFQLGLSSEIPWIEYYSGDLFKVRRYSGDLPAGQDYIDISDSPPEQLPSNRGVKLSIYCDPSGFMELEACGGCPANLETGTELTVNIITEYEVLPLNPEF
jgi:hypothetical protein